MNSSLQLYPCFNCQNPKNVCASTHRNQGAIRNEGFEFFAAGVPDAGGCPPWRCSVCSSPRIPRSCQLNPLLLILVVLKAILPFLPIVTCLHETTLPTDQGAHRRFGELQCHRIVMLRPNMNLNMMGKWWYVVVLLIWLLLWESNQTHGKRNKSYKRILAAKGVLH